jgi:hypothetical protein
LIENRPIAGHLRIEKNLQEQIPQFTLKFVPIADCLWLRDS